MQKAAPSLPRILIMVVFALSCFGLLLFLWLSFGGPVPLKPKPYELTVPFPEATTLAAPCATVEQVIKEHPEIEFLQGLTGLLTESAACRTG